MTTGKTAAHGGKWTMSDAGDYGKEYSEESFWEKLGKFALRAGQDVVEKALTLYYCLLDKDTPAWAKGVIVGTLGYFIVPMDAIPDATPVVGFGDDLGALSAALAMVAAHVKEEHAEKARETLRRWFKRSDEDGAMV